MCGIAGIIYKKPDQYVSPEIVERMCGVIHHRGPDDRGIWVQGQVGIGMTRLSIIDLSGGYQPIHNEDKTIWIVFNGEIYNYAELRTDLLKRGHEFYTSSDTETIIHLYEEYGQDCVNRLRGMFAFAIWDQKQEHLFIARDRLGIKPLHYYFDDKQFLFGSEIKSLLQCQIVPREMNPPALVNYLASGFVVDPATMFKGIFKLPPGHVLIYRKDDIQIRQYWQLKYEVEKVQSEEFYIERLLEILSEAVKLHLVSEVPLGAFLSGGTDSSMVVALMAKHMSQPVKTFSIGFENQAFNELKYARMVAQSYGTEHHEEIVNPDSQAVIMDLVQQFDEPFADSSAIPTYYVSRMAKKWVTVVLSGDGGDELFGGYTRYIDGPVAKYMDRIPLSLRKAIFFNLSKKLPEWFPGINILRSIPCSDDERYIRKMTGGLSSIHTEVFSPEFTEKVSTTDPSSIYSPYMDSLGASDVLTRRINLDTKTYLPCDILTKVDRTSMLTSLEARVPILDHHLVEFAATIPPELKVKGMTTKYLFKKAAERLLPKEVIYRPKQGFAVPVKDWIRNEWSEMSQDLVLSERARARRNFNPRFLERIMSEHRWGRRDHSSMIWALMVLELWFRETIDRHQVTG